MAYNLKIVMANKPSRFTAGHRMCAGCGDPPIARMVLRALKPEDHAVISNATGCMEVSSFLYIHILLGLTHISTQLLKMQHLLVLVWKQLIAH